GQVFIVVFEALSPLVFIMSERRRRLVILGFYGFHLVTALSLGITFAPHLVAMTSFFPLERLAPIRAVTRVWQQVRPWSRPSAVEVPLGVGERALGGAARHAVTVTRDPTVERAGEPLERSEGQDSA